MALIAPATSVVVTGSRSSVMSASSILRHTLTDLVRLSVRSCPPPKRSAAGSRIHVPPACSPARVSRSSVNELSIPGVQSCPNL